MSAGRDPLHDKIALVCGAGRPLGYSAALALAQAGASIAAHDLTLAGVEATLAQLENLGCPARMYISDCGKGLPARALVEDVLADYGRIDILVHAIHAQPAGTLLALDEWDWQHTLELNLNSAFLLMQSVLPAMQEQGGGVILNLLSGLQGSPSLPLAVSQHGLAALTHSAAAQLMPYNIHCYAVDAGIDGSAGQTEAALQDLLVYLCSPEANPYSGQTLHPGDLPQPLVGRKNALIS